MKRKKLWLKLLLDCIMLIVLTLLFWKDNFGMEFHEIAGLSLIGVFVLHVVFNWRWVKQVTARFLSKNITLRTRIGWLVDVGLFICFIMIGISGIFMSRVLFHFTVEGNWKTIHYFCSALAILFVGIHLGLHLTMIGHMFSNPLQQHSKIKKVIIGGCAVIVIAMGIYAIPTTSFTRWITMPFSMEMNLEHGERPEFEQNNTLQKTNDIEQVPQSPDKSSDIMTSEPDVNESERIDIKQREDGRDKPPVSTNIGLIVWKAVQYASLCILIAIFTWGIDYLLRHVYIRNKKEKVKRPDKPFTHALR